MHAMEYYPSMKTNELCATTWKSLKNYATSVKSITETIYNRIPFYYEKE